MNERDIFLAALEIKDPALRDRYLREHLPDDAARQRVDELLQAAGKVGDFLEVPAPEATAAYRPPVDVTGTVIAGKYKLREKLGEGGMGSVWVADQTEPVQRRVAIKLIRSGSDTKNMLARFEQERQALALMDHPHIAKVLDAGVDQHPYFVMELIKGVPLTKYCDDARLTPQQRLELFIPVCQAVQHAHQKGIIHRDLKPNNILIGLYDGRPVPKVIDFGVAKATATPLTEQSIYTEVGSLVGTLEYMSPEQAELNNLDIDTRTDIYALGVVLYELLTGGVPFNRRELAKAGLGEMLRVIKEVEPPKPSTRLSGSGTLPSIAASRHTEPAKLTKLVRGDLDWIVMKALDKDRSRRYETANGFAMDVQRYLAGEPVQAHPPTAAYRLRKFARRNRPQVIAAALVLLALVAGLVATSYGFYRAERERERATAAEINAIENAVKANDAAEAERQAKFREAERAEGERKAKLEAERKRQEAERNLAFAKKGNEILGAVFAGLDPRANYATVADLRNALRDNLIKAVKELEGSAVGDPVDVGDLQDTLGKSLLGLGEVSLAAEVHQKALNTCTEKLGPDHRYTLICTANLASTYLAEGKVATAVPLLEGVLARQKATLSPDHPDTLSTMNSLGCGYKDGGQNSKAVSLFEETVEKRKAKLGPDNPNTLLSMNNLGDAYCANDQPAKAVSLLEATFEKMKARLGPDHPDTLKCMSNLGAAYRATGQIAKVVPLVEAALEKMTAKLGPDHPDTLTSMNNLAVVYQDIGQPAKAVPILEMTLEKKKAKLGPDHRETINCMNNLATAYAATGQLGKAIPLLVEALEKSKTKLGLDHPDTISAMTNLAGALLASGQAAKAVPLFEEALPKAKARLGPENADLLTDLGNLARAYLTTGQPAKAVAIFEDTLQKQKAKLGTDHPETLVNMNNLATAYGKNGQFAKAEALLKEALPKMKAKLGPDHPNTITTMSNLADMYRENGQLANAVALYEATLEKMKSKYGPDHPDTRQTKNSLEFMRRLLSADERYKAKLDELGPKHIDTLLARRDLAQMYMSTNRFDAAESILADVLKGMSDRAPDDAIVVFTTGLLGRCVAGRQRTAPDSWATFNAQCLLGEALLNQKKYADAEMLLIKGYDGLKAREKSIPKGSEVRIPETLDRLIELYTATNKPDEAKKWQAERGKYPETKPAGKK